VPTWFRIIGDIVDVRVIARGRAIRELNRLLKLYGNGNWRKLKGYAIIEVGNSQKWRAELHWYECHGIGKKEIKVKTMLKRIL
jgi:hypothetical protein